MSVFVRYGFYRDVILKSYKGNLNKTHTEDITHFLSTSLTPYLDVKEVSHKLKVNEILYGVSIVGWRIKFNDPRQETIFRVKYSEYIDKT